MGMVKLRVYDPCRVIRRLCSGYPPHARGDKFSSPLKLRYLSVNFKLKVGGWGSRGGAASGRPPLLQWQGHRHRRASAPLSRRSLARTAEGNTTLLGELLRQLIFVLRGCELDAHAHGRSRWRAGSGIDN